MARKKLLPETNKESLQGWSNQYQYQQGLMNIFTYEFPSSIIINQSPEIHY